MGDSRAIPGEGKGIPHSPASEGNMGMGNMQLRLGLRCCYYKNYGDASLAISVS